MTFEEHRMEIRTAFHKRLREIQDDILAMGSMVGKGMLRVVPSAMYTSTTLMDSPDHTQTLLAVGGTFEYAYPLTSRLVAAGGLGFGVDFYHDSYEAPVKNGWGALRLSPTARFGRLDVGAHFQLVATSSRVVELAELGLDYFVW